MEMPLPRYSNGQLSVQGAEQLKSAFDLVANGGGLWDGETNLAALPSEDEMGLWMGDEEFSNRGLPVGRS